MLARTPAILAQPTLEGALCMLRFVALGVAAPLPGIEALQPENASRILSGALDPGAQEWFTVGAEFAMTGGHPDGSHDEFSSIANDLVVPNEGCHQPGVEVAGSLRLSGEGVHHHNYFANPRVRERLAGWLRV
jgi:hypothetical protein